MIYPMVSMPIDALSVLLAIAKFLFELTVATEQTDGRTDVRMDGRTDAQGVTRNATF